MASSSYSKSFRYDVFLSFAGEDTRYKFIGHLHHALSSNKIETYMDDKKIKKGERISEQLLKAIEDSRFHIIVFSKSYAASSWCLDELVKIMECQSKAQQTAYPLFFDVEPTEVRKQSGAVGAAFAKHEKREDANKWRDSLREAAAIVGWELKKIDNGDESKLIQIIVEEIRQKLRPINFHVDGKLVGMETRIKDVLSSMETDFDDVHMIGIKGMGGGGKTTLARALFDRISINFEGQSFVENVREVSADRGSGLKSLQTQIFSDVFNDPKLTVSGVFDGINKMKEMMQRIKVLLVLDDVSDIKQLEALAGATSWFKKGSKIIITTRDEQVLAAHGVKSILNVNLLTQGEAIRLFNKNAFGEDIPIQGFQELSEKVVRYAAGLPLTIKVLGSLLRGAELLDWISALDRLKTIPLHDTLQTLELSYDALEEDYKEIFLDVACILKGWKKETAIQALESCGFRARNGLRVLEQKSLISITEYGELGMHDHLEEMGKNIVRRSHPDEPNRHSRLWIQEEIEEILTNDSGNDAIQCIRWSSVSNDYVTYMRGLRNMKKLRVLDICYHGGLASQWFFPKALRYLKLDYYRSQSFMKSFQADNLVGLFMPDSRIMQFWKSGETKVLHKLRFLDMTYSDLTTLDLEMTPNIEMLNLANCDHLVELNMPLGCSNKLKALNIRSSKLKTLDLGLISNLETLSLENCLELVELHMPNDCPMLKSLNLKCCNLSSLNLVSAPNLDYLDVYGCHGLVELHVPSRCPKLRFLHLYSHKLRTLNLGLTSDLKILSLKECRVLEELHMPNGCPNLKSFIVENSKFKRINLGLTPDLEWLKLEGCHDLSEFHFQCLKLQSFTLKCSKLRTLDFRLNLDLEFLSLEECQELVDLHMPSDCPKLTYLNLKNSALRNLNLGLTPVLKTLSLEKCQKLVKLHMPSDCPKLKYLYLKNSALRNLNLGLPEDLGRLEGLEDLTVTSCIRLQDIPKSICDMRRLKRLNLSSCLQVKRLPREVGRLKCLKELNIKDTSISDLPDVIFELQGLHVVASDGLDFTV